jgi:formate C-acetyltransferase
LIDPKINLRVDGRTPDDLLELGAQLTEAGLGFPQYSNDEVVIPALIKKGYRPEDARDYTVAACWEFIIPGKGLDIVNLGAVSFPAAVDRALRKSVRNGRLTMEGLRREIRADIKAQVVNIFDKRRPTFAPSPLASALFDDALESGRDIAESARYRNYGLHGAASADGADAVAAIACLLEKGEVRPEQLMEAMDADFANNDAFEALREMLRTVPPKVGNAVRRVDDELAFLFDAFADACEEAEKEGLSDGRTIRPGTGSAQFYVFLSGESFPWMVEPTVGATADGRRKGEPFSSSLAPANGVQVRGPLSVLRSFSVIDYSRVMNGGPITMELAPSVFQAPEAYAKLASLIRYFVQTGNQQLQINLLGRETLLDAIKHPERHRNLIVRVWGWSGYFCELAPEFQRQIINRHSYIV